MDYPPTIQSRGYAASQINTKAAMPIQTKTRSRVLMRCGLGTGMDQGMDGNCNGENHFVPATVRKTTPAV